MNAVEIEEAVSALAAEPFSRAEFPYAFLTAFGNKETTVQRLRSGSSNTSDIPGGVLQRSNIHIAVCETGKVNETLTALRSSPKTLKGKVKFVLATDGVELEAQELATGEVLASSYSKFAEKFGFFLPLAGISTVAEIKNNPIDIKATSRLNKLYVELLKENPDWGAALRRQEFNQFMARLIFCFFAEDTGIFNHQGMFTACVKQMTASDSSNAHEVLEELFRAMDTHPDQRDAKRLKAWAREFPYVNGGLFTDKVDCPRFSKIARAYLLRVGELNWKEINPDIFGSMIQAVAEDDERGELGMHYTSVPNILKVLDPLFLDDLRQQLDEAEDNPRKLLNLRKRLANIRVFDPACGSGNFLVIAYIKMREIEAEIVKRRKEQDDKKAQKSWMKLTNFYGIEIKSFAAEIARLSLLIAEFQCNVRLIGQREACLDVLPLHDTGQIRTGNALQLNWLDVCPPQVETTIVEEDLGGPTGRLALDAAPPEAETYICGNPPFKGARKQSEDQKNDLMQLFSGSNDYKDCDYVSGWYIKVAPYLAFGRVQAAFVSTSSICEGEQVAHIWSRLFEQRIYIRFGHRPFSWSNNASNNAGVHCIIAGLCLGEPPSCALFDGSTVQKVASISPYLVPGSRKFIVAHDAPISNLPKMVAGSMPRDGGFLILSDMERASILASNPAAARIIRRLSGTNELINGEMRWCLWMSDEDLELAQSIHAVATRINAVLNFRQSSKAKTTKGYAAIPHKFAQRSHQDKGAVIVSKTSSERRTVLPASLSDSSVIISDAAFGIYGGGLRELAILTSRLHLAWIATICGKLETRYRYSSTLGWNTFPVPNLTEDQKLALARCAEEILIVREKHFPATIAELYDPEAMPADLRAAHDKNDETLERIYIGRRFKNDTERLEKLFDMYTRMAKDSGTQRGRARA